MRELSFLFIAFLQLTGCNQSSKELSKESVMKEDFSAIRILLDSIYMEDQKYRGEIISIHDHYGRESEEIKALWKKINKADSCNRIIVESILDEYGWLGPEQIGQRANSALFLVVQHSYLETQEKYLPMMRQAVKEGKAKSQSLALLEDRVRLRQGGLQIYGSQIGQDEETGEMYVLPLMEPGKVNERRANVGLGAIEDYISHWGLEWDVEEYKRELPQRMGK